MKPIIPADAVLNLPPRYRRTNPTLRQTERARKNWFREPILARWLKRRQR